MGILFITRWLGQAKLLLPKTESWNHTEKYRQYSLSHLSLHIPHKTKHLSLHIHIKQNTCLYIFHIKQNTCPSLLLDHLCWMFWVVLMEGFHFTNDDDDDDDDNDDL